MAHMRPELESESGFQGREVEAAENEERRVRVCVLEDDSEDDSEGKCNREAESV